MPPSKPAPVSLVIIDDHRDSLELLSTALAQAGLEISTAPDAEAGLDLIYTRHPQIVITDLLMPGMSGMEVLERVLEFDPTTDVILMSGHYSTESAVEAIRKGASDYLNKPVSVAMLRDRIGGQVEEARRRQRTIQLEEELLAGCEFQGMVGNSPLMWEVFSRIRRIAPHYRTALVSGATGTGKNLVARAIHRLSPAAAGRFVVLNCSSLEEKLLESELGLSEQPGGTLFLDEIGDMPLSTQAKLLRALEDQEIPGVIRVIAATRGDLRAAVADKQFREDLYYRLAMVEIRTPGLAERAEDIPLLERSFTASFAAQYGKTVRGLTPRARILLGRHNWPGNVRELENAIGHACMMVMGDTIDVRDLPEYLWDAGERACSSSPSAAGAAVASPSHGALEDQERRLIAQALERVDGNQSKAARLLHIGRDALRYKVKKHNL
jgi:DNA-binding NtrC family response regulator